MQKHFWTLEYVYEYGSDISLYPTKSAAIRDSISLILEWLCDVDDEEIENAILVLIQKGDYISAIRTYEDATDESFNWSLTDVQPAKSIPSQRELKRRAAKAMR